MAFGQQIELLLSGVRDASGNVLASGKVYTYDVGGLVAKTVYTDYTLATPAANPVVLDSAGRAQVYTTGPTKLIIKTSADVTLYTYDNLQYGGIGAATAWAPSYSASGSMTFTSVNTEYAKYVRIGEYIFFTLRATGTTGGTASTDLRATLPAAADSVNGGVFAAWTQDTTGSLIAASAFLSDVNTIAVRKYATASNYGLGAGPYLSVSGFYKAA